MALNRWHLVHIGGWIVGLIAVALIALWAHSKGWTDPEAVRELLAPYRSSWVGLPVVLLVFVVAELFFFPVLLLIAGCGLAFGPWLGSIYALVGSVASAILPFFIGRRLGKERLLRWGGPPAKKLIGSLKGKGLVAAFLIRKIPAPFSLVNMLCGASGLRLRDFVLGTALGMLGGIVIIALVSGNVANLATDGGPRRYLLGGAMLVVVLAVVLVLQRFMNRRLGRQP